MANQYLQTLIPLLSLLLVSAAAGPTSFSFGPSSKDLTAGEIILQGDALLTESGMCMLTRIIVNEVQKNSVGRIVWSDPIEFSSNGQQLDFETTLSFLINPVDSQPGEGITFFIAPVGTTIPEGSAGGYLGVFSPEGSNANTLAIEFDAHYNTGIDGPMMPHIGIDIESPRSSNFTYVGSAMIGQQVTANIKYSHEDRLIIVTLYAGNQVFQVSYVRDLSTVLTPQAQIGISGATGENVALHLLYAWEFRSLGYVPISSTYQLF